MQRNNIIGNAFTLLSSSTVQKRNESTTNGREILSGAEKNRFDDVPSNTVLYRYESRLMASRHSRHSSSGPHNTILTFIINSRRFMQNTAPHLSVFKRSYCHRRRRCRLRPPNHAIIVVIGVREPP